MGTVVLIGTLDTKEREYRFMHDCLRAMGVDVLVMDVGILRDPQMQPDIAAAEVAAAAGAEIVAVVTVVDRKTGAQAAVEAAGYEWRSIIDLDDLGLQAQ